MEEEETWKLIAGSKAAGKKRKKPVPNAKCLNNALANTPGKYTDSDESPAQSMSRKAQRREASDRQVALLKKTIVVRNTDRARRRLRSAAEVSNDEELPMTVDERRAYYKECNREQMLKAAKSMATFKQLSVERAVLRDRLSAAKQLILFIITCIHILINLYLRWHWILTRRCLKRSTWSC
jgi:hypothetical protein